MQRALGKDWPSQSLSSFRNSMIALEIESPCIFFEEHREYQVSLGLSLYPVSSSKDKIHDIACGMSYNVLEQAREAWASESFEWDRVLCCLHGCYSGPRLHPVRQCIQMPQLVHPASHISAIKVAGSHFIAPPFKCVPALFFLWVCSPKYLVKMWCKSLSQWIVWNLVAAIFLVQLVIVCFMHRLCELRLCDMNDLRNPCL